MGGSVDIEFTTGLEPTPPDTHLYDRNGRLRVSTDSTGHVQYFVYDKMGRRIADVDEYGAVTEYRYDALDRLRGTTRYYNKATAADLELLADPDSSHSMSALRPTAHLFWPSQNRPP